ncbi:MAG: DUF6769 family protein [Candidatus Limimorpha sp.]|nr:hypothetical protein [Bacteroidales bacterium]
MMKKIKGVGLFMIMVSCAILLFHAVIPHHHHQGVTVCLENHQHECNGHHDGTNHGDCDGTPCVISDFFPPSNTQNIDNIIGYVDNIVSYLYFTEINCLQLIFGLEGTQFRELPYLLKLNETDVVRLGVLRAPPSC